jgi:mannose-6-phosphate isomerase-like protein (cupin superfamily)
MSASDTRAFDLARTYVHLADGGMGAAIDVGPAFWQELMTGARDYPGRLAMVASFAEDWPHWEMHPAGEELIYLLSGAADVVLDDGAKERTVALRAEAPCLLMPRGVWHRFSVIEPGAALFVTAGEGTQHRPV